jgi:type VI secretion system protein ImpL
VPNSPEPNQPYDEKTYNALEAYLMTASYPEKSTQAFLSPVLLNFWRGTRDIEAPQGELAKQQFDFYAKELAIQNPYPSTAFADEIVAHARGYLKNFKGIDRYYLPLLSEADGKTAPVTFNGLFRSSKDVVVNDVPVRRAFTKDGFAFLKTALTQQRYLIAEEWVLGNEGTGQVDILQLRQSLAQRYADDFLKVWYNVLTGTRFLPYGSVNDADSKLRKVAASSSPLLELFWFVSRNTDVDSDEIRAAFQPVQAVVPPGTTDKYIQATNQQYMSALTALSTNVSSLASNGGLANREAVTKVSDAMIVAKNEVGGIAQKFAVSQELPVHQVSRVLLEAPIANLEAVIRGASSAGLNRGGQDFCHDVFSPMTQYFPFNTAPNATDLPLKQFDDVFAPGVGALWKYADTLKDYPAKRGSQCAAVDSGTVHINPLFVAFLDRAAALSNALYPEGASPKFTFSLGQLQTDVDGLTIKIGSQSLAMNEPFKTFTWTGSENDSVQVSAKGAPYGSNTGPWAVFHFFSGATWHDAGPNLANLERTMETNGQTMRLPPPDNRVMYYRYQLNVGGTNAFRPSEWSNMKCISRVAR